MDRFLIHIANKTIEIETHFRDTRALCASYLIEGQADISVTVTPEEIQHMRRIAEKESALEANTPCDYSDGYLETLAVYRKICDKLVDYDIILMHGSVVAVNGEAYLFTAKSGTGKSTHTRYWREVFGSRAIMINDDKPLLQITQDGVLACGTPWDGKHHLNTNTCLPLKGICILERGTENRIKPISAQEALPMIFQQTHRPQKIDRYMEIVDQLTRRVNFYRMQCTLDPCAAEIAYATMKKG